MWTVGTRAAHDPDTVAVEPSPKSTVAVAMRRLVPSGTKPLTVSVTGSPATAGLGEASRPTPTGWDAGVGVGASEMAIGDADGRAAVGVGLGLGGWVAGTVVGGGSVPHAPRVTPMRSAVAITVWQAVRSWRWSMGLPAAAAPRIDVLGGSATALRHERQRADRVPRLSDEAGQLDPHAGGLLSRNGNHERFPFHLASAARRGCRAYSVSRIVVVARTSAGRGVSSSRCGADPRGTACGGTGGPCGPWAIRHLTTMHIAPMLRLHRHAG
jgi:hypothetical protein